jgi:hypothetical protein
MGVDMNENKKDLGKVVDDAVRAYPVPPAPDQILIEVMRQIKSPAFFFLSKISFLDIFFSTLLAIVTGISVSLIQNLVYTPYWAARVRMEFVLSLQQARLVLQHNQAELIALSVGCALFVIMSLLMTWVYYRETAAVAA